MKRFYLLMGLFVVILFSMIFAFSSFMKREPRVFGENWDRDTTSIREIVHEKWNNWKTYQMERLHAEIQGKKISIDTVFMLKQNIEAMASVLEEREFTIKVLRLFEYYYNKPIEKREYYFTLRSLLRIFFMHDKIEL